MKTTKDLQQFVGYDLAVAQCHMENWGKIFLDEYEKPLDVEDVVYMLEEENEE